MNRIIQLLANQKIRHQQMPLNQRSLLQKNEADANVIEKIDF